MITERQCLACRLGYHHYQHLGDNNHPDKHGLGKTDVYAFYTGMEAARTRQSLPAALKTLELPTSHNGFAAIGN